MSSRSDTIAALCTPQGKGGISIIRLSGRQSIRIASEIIKSSHKLLDYSKTKTRKMIHGYLLDENQQILDEVLVAIFPPLKSYTGEETVEINCHGGKGISKIVLQELTKFGARIAQNGEFTRRALENGRIDLIHAEAINEIIQAENHFDVRAAREMLYGSFRKSLDIFKNNLIRIISEIEFAVETGYDLEDKFTEIEYIRKEMIRQIGEVLKNSKEFNKIRNKLRIVIAGNTNTGKSTLFNALIDKNRAIVSEISGTTRDYLIEEIDFQEYTALIIDTAGKKEIINEIEMESIKRSEEQIDASDILIQVFDITKDLAGDIEDILENLNNDNFLLVFNKHDQKAFSGNELIIDNLKNNRNCFICEAINKNGTDKIYNYLKLIVQRRLENLENPITITIRQERALNEASNILMNLNEYSFGNHIDAYIFEIKSVVRLIEELTGKITSDEVLDSVFKNFCVGK